MSNNYGNKEQEDSDDERELDEQNNQNPAEVNANGLIMNPPTSKSISNSIVNEQENTGFGKNVNAKEQSIPSISFNNQNDNGLINKGNNNDYSQYLSKKFIEKSSQQSKNSNSQIKNFINGSGNINDQVLIYNQNINNNKNNQNINNNNRNNFNNKFNNNNFNNINFNNNNFNNNNFNNNLNNFNNNNNLSEGNYNHNDNVEYGNNNMNNYPNNNNQMNNNNQNPNNNNQMINQSQYPFSNITNPIETPLIKLGETEYLNAILYLIGNIKDFCEYFYIPNQNNKFVKNIEKAPLSFIIHRLFLHLYPLSDNEKGRPYRPDAIKKYLSEINCVYKSDKKRNPNELFSFILDILHNELKKPPRGALENPNNVFDKKEVIRTGIKNFKNCDLSKISENFNWFEIKETRCTQCNQSMYSFQTYHMLELDILNTSKLVANNRNYNNNNSINIYDCLTYYQSKKTNLRAYCKLCNKNTLVDCASKIFSNPNIFAFSLNRGLINGNFDDNLTDINFQLNEQIDLGNFVSENIQNSKYELTGIVSISRRLKNYVSFCKSPIDNNWYAYDSENICPYKINYILSEHDGTKETDNIPCILVYQLIKLSH